MTDDGNLKKFYEKKHYTMENKMKSKKESQNKKTLRDKVISSKRNLNNSYINDKERVSKKDLSYHSKVSNTFTGHNSTNLNEVSNNKTTEAMKTPTVRIPFQAYKQSKEMCHSNSFRSTSQIISSSAIYKSWTSLTPVKYALEPEIFRKRLNTQNSNEESKVPKSDNINMRLNTIEKKSSKSIILDNLYAEYIQNTFQKRKESSITNKPQTPKESYELFYEKNISFLIEKEQKADAERLNKEALERSFCTFHPQLSKNTLELFRRSKSHDSLINFYEKTKNWKMNKEKSLSLEKEESDKRLLKECTFQPNPYKTKQIIQSMKDKKDDYIYIKNIKWLKQVNLNRTKAQKEQLQLHSQQINLIKEQNKTLIDLANSKQFFTSKEHLDLLAKPKHLNKSQSSINVFQNNYVKNNISNISLNIIQPNIDIKNLKSLLNSLKQSLKQNKDMVKLISFSNVKRQDKI